MTKQKSWADYDIAIRNVYTKHEEEDDDSSVKSPDICKLAMYTIMHTSYTHACIFEYCICIYSYIHPSIHVHTYS